VDQYIANQLQQGFQLLQNKRLLDAQHVFEDVLKVEPLNEHGLNLLGALILDQHSKCEAVLSRGAWGSL
jgi:hypothetical protein